MANNNGESPVYYIVAVVFIAFSVAGIMSLKHWQDSKALRLQMEAQQQELEREQRQEKARLEEQERAKAREEERRLEQERRKLEKEAEEIARREKYEAEKRARDEERKAKEALQEQARNNREEVRATLEVVRNAKYDYWRNCPKGMRPQTTSKEREYVCVLPKSASEILYMKIHAIPGSDMQVQMYETDGDVKEVSNDEFNSMIKNKTYLIVSEGSAWICGAKKPGDGMAMTSGFSTYNPAQQELDTLYNVLYNNNIRPDSIKYDIRFYDQNKESILVKRVSFGESVTSYEVRSRIREELQKNKKASTPKKKKKKRISRTVVFDDSVTGIVKTIGGPIKIPRTMPNYSGTYYSDRGRAVYHYDKDGRESYGYGVKRSTNANGFREKEYMRLREIAEREDREERELERTSSYEKPQSSYVEESEVDVVFHGGRIKFEVVK